MLKFNIGSMVRLYYKYQMEDTPRTGKIVKVTEDTISLMPQKPLAVWRRDGERYEIAPMSINAYKHPIVLERSAIAGWVFIQSADNEQTSKKINERELEAFLEENGSLITKYTQDGFCLGESEDNH